MIKNSPVNVGDIRDVGSSMHWEDSLEWAWQPTPVFLPEESIQQGSLVGYIVHGVTKSQTQLKILSTYIYHSFSNSSLMQVITEY